MINRVLLLMAILLVAGCNPVDRDYPQLVIRTFPNLGDSGTVFLFDASASTDNLTEPWQLKVRWDAESDGTWETGFSIQKKFAWRYPSSGTYSLTGEMMDGTGNRSTQSVEVVVRELHLDSLMIDPRDSRSYKTVLLIDRWWLRENLKFGHPVDNNDVTRDDTITEYYHHTNSTYGGFYTWQEATIGGTDTVTGICPPGWRLPRRNDIQDINELLYFRKNLDKYLLDEGVFGLDFSLSGRYIRSVGVWEGQGNRTSFWITDGKKSYRFKTWMLYRREANEAGLSLVHEGDWGAAGVEGWPREWGEFNYGHVALPVRCVKDQQ